MLVVPLLGSLIVSGRRIYGSTSSCKGMGGGGEGGRGDDYRKVARLRHYGTIYRNFGGTGVKKKQ